MASLLAFAVTLLVAVLISGIAHRSVLSTAVLFLVAGFFLGDGVANVVTVTAQSNSVEWLAELALFSVLFTDGMRANARELRVAWQLPGRALLLGLPLTLIVTALFARYVVDLSWYESFLVGAVLSPTDPVFAAAIVGREEIPYRLRQLLNVESGLNDGLALPVVVVLITLAAGGPHPSAARIAWEVVTGTAIGVIVPRVAIALSRSRLLSPTSAYEPLYAFSIGTIVYALTFLMHVNPYLAAFAAGVTVASVSPQIKDAFNHFGELVTELLKLGAIFVFGALISPSFLADVPARGYAFAIITLLFARPIALAIALVRSELAVREWLAAAWFGPKGFASVVYGLLVLEANLTAGDALFHLIAITVTLSIVAHSSSDVVVARSFT